MYIIISRFFICSILLLMVEAFWRITHPVFNYSEKAMNNEDLKFYAYKFNSIMYQDSNFVGIFIVTMFFFLLYIDHKTGKRSFKTLFLLLVLCFLTASRASIVALLVFWVIFRFNLIIRSMRKGQRIYMYLVSINILALAALLVFTLFAKDGSFVSKFYIIEKTFDFYKNASVTNILFGVGFGNTVQYFGIGAHNFIIAFLIESGVVGLLFLSIFWIQILRKSSFEALVVMVPFLINGMSLAGHAVSYLYVMYGLIYIISSRPQNGFVLISKFLRQRRISKNLSVKSVSNF
ncbi:hypothetical protein [Pseudobacteroides cellulosolvens]|nr:hypothetical protein [Pseudobacteroides cellulosolvens]